MQFFRTQLECGATLIGQKLKDRPVVFGCSIPYGSAHDKPRLQGMAHFLEHMLFESETNLRKEIIEKQLDAYGGDMNAYTEYLRTVVYCCVPPREIINGVRFICELVRRPNFRPHDLGLERKIIRIETDMAEDDPLETGEDLINLAMYHPPFGALVRGKQKTIRNITSEDLLKVWKRAYNPSGFTFSFAGDVSGDIVKDAINSSLDRHELLSTPYVPLLPPTIVPQTQNIFQAKKGLKKTHLRLGYQSPHLTDPLYPAFCVLDVHLAGGPFSNLFQEIREKRGLAYRVTALEDSGARHGAYCLFIGTPPGKVKKVCQIVKREIEASVRISKERFEYARDRILGVLDSTAIQPEERMSDLLEWETDGPGAERLLQKKEYLQKATLEEVRTVARKLSEQEPAKVFISSPKFIHKYRAKYM